MSLETFNILVGAGTLLIALVIVCLVLFRIVSGTKNQIMDMVRRDALVLGFLLGLAAIVGSLTYSEIYHLTPCVFCWWQRIFLYPQAIIFAVALYRHGRSSSAGYELFYYSTPMAVISCLFSIYHVLLQRGIIGPSAACLQGSVSCATIDIQSFGFLTMPAMALILGGGLALLGGLVIAHMRRTKKTA
jgi:disulfide bond formation protein DsbB